MLDAPSMGLISGAALLGAAAWRMAFESASLALRGKRSRRRLAERRDAWNESIDGALRAARAGRPSLKSWLGVRPFRVAAVVDEAVDCRSYYLVPEDGRPLPRFEPGQYLTFHLPCGDSLKPLVRCYSLSDRPREDYYRVTVKRAAPPADRPEIPGGRGSGYFHREVRPGTKLQVEAPQGGFFLDPLSQRPLVLCGAGVGVTPLISMASELVRRGDRRAIYLALGFRNGREHLFRSHLAELADEAARLTLDVSYSRPLPTDRIADADSPGDYHRVGRVDAERLKQLLPSNNFQFYLCGPAAMMEALAPALVEWGVPVEDVHYEAFGPATVRGLGRRTSSSPCQVEFARSGRRLAWTGDETSLLELAERNGLTLDAGCRAGSCGQCRLALAAGLVRHAKPPGVALADGECLACIAQPEGDVIVDA